MCNNKTEHFTFKKTWQSFHGSGFTRLSFESFFHVQVDERRIFLPCTNFSKNMCCCISLNLWQSKDDGACPQSKMESLSKTGKRSF